MDEPSSSIAGLAQRHTWQRYNSDIIKVILEALSILRTRDGLITNEVDLTRKLFFCFKRAAYNLGLNYHLPTPEGNNPPYEDDEQRAKREDKRPDFYWQFCDNSVNDPKWCDRRFVLECKRLGYPKSSSPKWVLNQNYVQHGIDRFLTEEHQYAKGDETGAMIGFIESMEFDVILHEVNTNIVSHNSSIPPLSLSEKGWQFDSISILKHTLIRTFPISPFQLLHFWLDIRNCDLSLPEPKPAKKSTQRTGKNFEQDPEQKVASVKDSKKHKRKTVSQEVSQIELPINQSQ